MKRFGRRATGAVSTVVGLAVGLLAVGLAGLPARSAAPGVPSTGGAVAGAADVSLPGPPAAGPAAGKKYPLYRKAPRTDIATAKAKSWDVIVYGGSAGGVISAVAAGRAGKSVLLIEESAHLGGLVAGGLGGTDIGRSETIGGLSREFFDRVRRHYVTVYGADSAQAKTAGAQGYQFEPHVAAAIFDEMLTDAKVVVSTLTRVESVRKEGTAIAAAGFGRTNAMGDEKPVETAELTAKIWIDASYEGDLLAKAGVKYHVGREANSVYGETLNGVRATSPAHQFPVKVDGRGADGKPLPLVQADKPGAPGEGDRKTQAYNFRLCLTRDPANRVDFPKPPDYDAKRYELLARLFVAQPGKTAQSFLNNRIMPNGKTDTNNNGPISSDFIGGNWDYPEADYATRRRIHLAHVSYHQGLMYFLANDPAVPEAVRKEFNIWGLAKDEFPATAHWPHQLYVREARRMIGAYVMAEKDIFTELDKADGVCLGSYNTDSHHVQRVLQPDGTAINEGDFQVRVTPYAIPWRSLLPRHEECSNLLAVVCCSASHVAYGTIRMEPVYMMMGHAAGTGAAMALDAGDGLHSLKTDALRAKLLEQKAILDPKPFQSGGGRAVLGGGRFDPKPLGGTVVDDEEAARTGAWTRSGATPGFVGEGYHHDGNEDKGKKTVRYAAKVPAAGKYVVLVLHTPGTNRATNVPVTVQHAGGKVEAVVNQRKAWTDGKPPSVGTFEFAADGSGWVEIGTTGTDGHVIADAVIFVPVK